ncbi:MAG: GNAT family N-acetyltransferase [Proteobacteria bacterium]|nr:GNAT family N-acetyltransferase [Pseudomonadota bacterium]
MTHDEFSHRPLAADDLPSICGFVRTKEELFFMFPAANWPLSCAQLAQAATQRREPTVFLWEGEVAGYANFRTWEPDQYCEVGNVVVDPALRRRGLASRIMAVMEAKARDAFEAKQLQVSCFSMNTGGLILYSRLGFLATGIATRSGPDGAPSTLIHLKKNILGASR